MYPLSFGHSRSFPLHSFPVRIPSICHTFPAASLPWPQRRSLLIQQFLLLKPVGSTLPSSGLSCTEHLGNAPRKICPGFSLLSWSQDRTTKTQGPVISELLPMFMALVDMVLRAFSVCTPLESVLISPEWLPSLLDRSLSVHHLLLGKLPVPCPSGTVLRRPSTSIPPSLLTLSKCTL